MRIAICDDDRQEREAMLNALHGWDPTRSAEMFVDGASLLAAAQTTPHFSIVFLDIYMPMENGVDVAKKLRAVSPETGVVFTTTSAEHAVDAFSLGAVHYLVKPVTTESIREVFDRVQKMQFEERRTLSVRIGRSSRLFYLDEITTIFSLDHDCVISMTDQSEVRVHMTLYDLYSQLDSSFIQLQRGLVANMLFIEQMQYDSCRLRNGQEILLSRKDRKAINTAYNDFIFNELSARAGLAKGMMQL